MHYFPNLFARGYFYSDLGFGKNDFVVLLKRSPYYLPRYSLFTYATHPSPSYGGVNSGLMLMNLDGLRKSPWTKAILTINEELAPFNVYGDQVTNYKQTVIAVQY
jgi:hypothetical protein